MTAAGADAITGWETVAKALGDRACHGSAHRAHEPGRAFSLSGDVDAQRVAALLPPERFPSIFDLGCGTGRVTLHLLYRYGRVLAVDPSLTMIQAAGERCVGHGNGRFALSFPSGETFSGGVALNVLTHVPKADLPALLTRVGGLLRRGGRFVFNLPFVADGEEGSQTFPEEQMLPGGVNWWSHDEFYRDVIDVGPWTEGCLTPPRPRAEWSLEHAPLSWLATT